MILFITSDANWESKLGPILDSLLETQIKRFFLLNDYGSSIKKISVFLICRDSNLKFKQRIRFLKEEKKLSMDIMLDFDLFKQLDLKQKKNFLADRFITEIPTIIKNYKLPDFDLIRFESDLMNWMRKIEWLQSTLK